MQLQHRQRMLSLKSLKSRDLSLALIAALTMALLLIAPLARSASVRVHLDAAEGANGDEAEVPILVEGAPGIGAMHVELTYDPAVLEATNVEKGDLLDDGSLIDFNFAEPGRIVIGFVTLESVEGDGAIAVAQFNVIGEDDAESELAFENTQAWEGGENRFDILVTAEGSTFTVASASSFPWLWLIIALIALILLLIAFLARRRKPAVATVPVAVAPATGATIVTPPQPTPMATTGSFCSKCGTPLSAGTQFCPKCGTRVVDAGE